MEARGWATSSAPLKCFTRPRPLTCTDSSVTSGGDLRGILRGYPALRGGIGLGAADGVNRLACIGFRAGVVHD